MFKGLVVPRPSEQRQIIMDLMRLATLGKEKHLQK
jgi:hypothetical protein